MSFQDPTRRQRPPRYPALAQYEDRPSAYDDPVADHSGGQGYQDGYRGFAGLADAPRQRPPWDDPRQRTAWGSGAQQTLRDSGSQPSVWDTGSQQTLRDSGSQRSVWDTGAQEAVRNTGAHRSTRNTGAHRSVRDTSGQETSWDVLGQDAGPELPRRTSGAFRAVLADGERRPRPTSHSARRDGRGLLAGAVAGFLAAAVALGVANLVAAFVRPQASPIIAVGEAFIDRTPPALKNFAVQKFGENDKTMLLLGMYVTIAFLALSIGMLAWRRVWAGVAGIGLFGLFGAFVAITRPDSHVTDVIPSIIGGIAGITAILVLVRAGMPRARATWARGR